MDYVQYVYEKLLNASGLSSSAANSPKKVVAYGNILLDHAVQLKDVSPLMRHGLKLGTKGELQSEQIKQIIDEALLDESTKPVLNPGGSALNTVRILKHLNTVALFCGAVGDDEYAQVLIEMLKERGIATSLQTVSDASTGLCACLVFEDNPTLYANIGASARFDVEHLRAVTSSDDQTVLRPPHRKQIHYIEGFFVPHRAAVCDYVVENFICERRRLAINLSAPYIVRENFEVLLRLAQSAYFIFGNREEFKELCAQMNCADFEQMAEQLRPVDRHAAKTIIITKGADGVEVISNYVDEQTTDDELSFHRYNAPRVASVLDATGAGDAFVAGFLDAWLEKRSLSECVRIACDIAAKVVTEIGCNLPDLD